MVRTLAALESLPRGETLVQLDVREPRFRVRKVTDVVETEPVLDYSRVGPGPQAADARRSLSQ